MKFLILNAFPGILRGFFFASKSLSSFTPLSSSVKLVSEVFAFASPPKVDGNMIVEMIPPRGLGPALPLRRHSL